jgi:hypothetical protein
MSRVDRRARPVTGQAVHGPPMTTPYVIGYERSFHLPAPPMVVWSVLEGLDGFADKAVWLAKVGIDDGSLRDGSVVRATIATPLPYRIRVRLEVDSCTPGRHVDAWVKGDLQGVARLCGGDSVRRQVDPVPAPTF